MTSRSTQLKPLVETYLASLPAKGRKEKEKDLKIRKASWRREEDVQARLRAQGERPARAARSAAKWTRDDDRDMNILSSVLSMKLREVDARGHGRRLRRRRTRPPSRARRSRSAASSISFGCDPARVDELVKAALDGAEKLKKDDVDAETLERVKQTFVRSRETELRNNNFWLGWLANAYKYGDDPASACSAGGTWGNPPCSTH